MTNRAGANLRCSVAVRDGRGASGTDAERRAPSSSGAGANNAQTHIGKLTTEARDRYQSAIIVWLFILAIILISLYSAPAFLCAAE